MEERDGAVGVETSSHWLEKKIDGNIRQLTKTKIRLFPLSQLL